MGQSAKVVHHAKVKVDHHAKMAEAMKQRLKVEELAENIDELEDVVEDVFPILMFTVIISTIILIIFLIRMYIRYTVPNPSKNKIGGKTVLITGGTSGLGKATALELAKRNARVLITGKEKVKVEAVARNIRKKTGNQHVNALQLDLGNLRNIREFVEEFNKDEKSLHVLINNAGYMGPKSATNDGLERAFAVNYLGHFYLTHLLTDKELVSVCLRGEEPPVCAPISQDMGQRILTQTSGPMKKNAPARIINVVSDAYTKGTIDFEDLALNKGYDVSAAYARSKFAQMVFTLECHRRLFGGCVWSFAVNPGACNTELLRSYPGLTGNLLRVVSRVMFKPPEDGCETIVYCAVADGLRDASGKLFANCKVVKTNDKVKDKAIARKLWSTSAHLCGFESDVPFEEEEEVKPDGAGAPKAEEDTPQ